MKNFLRVASVVVVVGFVLDAAVTWFWPHALVGATGAAHKIAGPFGTAIVAAIYFCRDMFVDSKGSSYATAQASASPSINNFNIENFNVPPDLEPDPEKIEDIVRSVLDSAPRSDDISKQRYFIHDAKGNRRGMFGVTDEGTAALLMSNSKQKPIFSITDVNGSAQLVLGDDEGRPRVSVHNGSEWTELSMLDSRGLYRLRLTLASGDQPSITLADERQKNRLILGIASNGECMVGLMDENFKGRVLLSEDGLSVLNAEGKRLWGTPLQPSEDAKG